MDILRFIKWWWNKKNYYDKVFTASIGWTLMLFPNMYFFGSIGFQIFFIGILLCVVGFFLNQLRISLMEQWDRFQEEREYEARVIIARLDGTSIPREPKLTTAQTILQRIRARRIR